MQRKLVQYSDGSKEIYLHVERSEEVLIESRKPLSELLLIMYNLIIYILHVITSKRKVIEKYSMDNEIIISYHNTLFSKYPFNIDFLNCFYKGQIFLLFVSTIEGNTN